MVTRIITKRRAAPSKAAETADGGDELQCVDARLDEALKETFPASDPVAITPPRAKAITGRSR
jgi:hypothetical protein